MYCSSWQASHGSGISTSQSLPHNPDFSLTTLCNGPREPLAVPHIAWPQQFPETTEKQSVVSSILDLFLFPMTTCTAPSGLDVSLGWTLTSLDHSHSWVCSCLCPCLPSAGIESYCQCLACFCFLITDTQWRQSRFNRISTQKDKIRLLSLILYRKEFKMDGRP